jgi:uncharacterized protein (TIGR00251 family)
VALPCLREVVSGAVELSVLVQPRASRSRLVGMHGESLKVSLAAPPVDGAANEALIELLADTFGVPKRHVQLISGEASRRKRLRLEGIGAARAEAVIQGLL